MRFRNGNVTVLLVALLSLSSMALAQETTGTIRGRVLDAQGLAVPGVVVTATGGQGVKTVSSDTEGRFSIPFLTPGSYAVKAELQGFKTAEQRDIVVSVGQTVDIPLKMEVGAVAETVEVQAASSVINTATTTIGAVLSANRLALVPVGRRVSDALYVAPGVSNSGMAGRSNPSISGGTGLENNYVVDGANVTNTGYGGLGSYSIVFGSLGNATPYDFVQEIQVKTGGYDAEFGQATGGVVNVITKSGSNDLRGSAFAYSQPDWLEGSWKQYQALNGSVNTQATRVTDMGAEGGGPVIKNKVFFFGAIDPSWQTRAQTAPPDFPLASLGDIDRDRHTVSYAAKATAQLGSPHRIDASFFGDPSHGDTGPQRTSALLRTTTSGFSTLDYGGHQQAVRYNGILNSGWLVEASWARSKNSITELPSVDTWRTIDKRVTPNINTGGIGSYEQGNLSINRQYALKSTNIFSGHQVKYGFQYDNVDYTQNSNRTGPTFLAPDGRQTATGAEIDILPDPDFGTIYRVTRANFNIERPTFQDYYNLFLQDSWQVNRRLTINAGVRWEQEKLAGTLIDDFELKNNWAPRIGATFDASGDGRTKVFGNWGRYYARIPNDLAARALSADDGFTRGDYFDANLTRPVPEGVTALGVTRHYIVAGVGADTIDPNAKLSYQDEVVAGFEREFLVNTTFGVRYVYRNFGRVLEDVANCPMVAYDLPQTSTACSSVDYILTNPSSSTPINPAATFLGAAFDDPVHKYNAIEVTLNRRAANWSALASYRYSRLRGNFEGFFRDDNGQSDPGISSLYDFPTNDPSYALIGVPRFGYAGDIRFLGDKNGILPLDRPNQVKLYGNYTFTSGFNAGIGLNLSDGRPLTAFAANPNYQSDGEIPEAARGTGIQTVDGFKTRSPFESQVDLHASYVLKMGGARRLTLLADAFNLFNQRRITGYDYSTQLDPNTANPDFGKPVNTLVSGTPPQFQAPFNLRAGIRFEF
jgi:outer membrane receptor protein involved in Fe transport